MRRIRVAACAGLALVLAGCWWPLPGQGPSRQAHNDVEDDITAAVVVELEEAWTAYTAGGNVGDPVVSVRGVHVSDASSLYTFLTGTGEERWSYHPESPVTMEQPFVRGEEILAGSLDPSSSSGPGPTWMFDAATGVITETLTAERAPAAVRNNRVMFWGRSVVVTMDVLDLDTSTWICCDDLLFGGSGGRDRWPQTLGTELFFDAGQGLTHTEIDDLGNGVRGYQISPPNPCWWIEIGMCPVWATPLDGDTSSVPVLSDDEDTVYVGTDAGTLYAVETQAGDILWSADVGSAVTDTPALADGSLFIPTASDGLVVLDANGCGVSACSPTWSGSTGSSITQQPAVAGGVVFVGTDDGTVHAFDAAGCSAPTCSDLWSAATSSEITGAPAVSNGRLYVGTNDGRLIAYGLGS